MESTAQDSARTPEKMDPRLHKAVREGKIELLTRIMEGESPPDLTLCLTPQKNTALHIAVRFGHQNIVKKMIQLQPSLISQSNCKGDTPLHMAARAGHLSLTKLLTPTSEEGALSGELGGAALRMKNMDGSTAIHEALKKGHEKVALHLLRFDQGMGELARDVNLTRESPLYLAAEAGLAEVVTEIMGRGNFSSEGPQRQTPLHIAVIKGRLGVVKILVRLASHFIQEVDDFGKTALHYASTIGQYVEVETRREILNLLLQANPSLAYVSDHNGDYPLLIASTRGPFAAVKIILDHCPDSAELVDQKGHNALHLAVMKKNDDVLKYLINRSEFKKLINERDFDGNTPMHLAAMANNNEIVKLLLLYEGVNLAATNREGLTAMDICGYTMKQHTNRDELRIHGAVPGRHQWHEQLFVPLPPPPSPSPPSPPPPPPPPRPIYKVCVYPRSPPTPLLPYLRRLGKMPRAPPPAPAPLPLPPSLKGIKISSDLKSVVNTLSIVTALVATITFAAAFTVPGGYRNDGPYEGEPVFIRKGALKVFLFSDTLAFCSSMAATVLLVYASAMAEDGLLFKTVLKRCSYVSGVAVLATITAFITGVYVLVPKESLWLAIIPMLLGCAVPLCVVLCLMLKLRNDKSGEEGEEGVGV